MYVHPRIRRALETIAPVTGGMLFALATSTTQAATEEELAKQLSNPIADLISVPLQLNYDNNVGTAEQGWRYTLNIQPVIPFSINQDWNVISRTILPVVDQKEIYPGSGRQSGLGDTLQSLFFSPKKPTEGGWIWGVGPVFLLPTGTDDLLTADKWGIGPTGVALKQEGPWTVGFLWNHVWSFAGDDSRSDISSTFLQPFLTYVTKTKTTFSINTESTYDWKNKQWSVPINAGVSQLVKVGDQLVNIGVLARYWANGPDSGPHGWGARVVVTLLFPK